MDKRMQDPAFLAYFNNLKQTNPEQAQALLQKLSTDYQGQRGALNDQMAQAEALRGTATPQGRNVSNRIYTAANPLEDLAAAHKQRQGMKSYDDALAKKKELADMYGSGIQETMAAMLREDGDNKKSTAASRLSIANGHYMN